MSIYGGNMKKQKIFLKNKQLLGFYLVVGVFFCYQCCCTIYIRRTGKCGYLPSGRCESIFVFTCFNIYTFTTVFHCGSVFFSVFPD